MAGADVLPTISKRESVMSIRTGLSFVRAPQKPFLVPDEAVVFLKVKSVESGFNSVADMLSSVRWALYYSDGNHYSSVVSRLNDSSCCLISSLRDIVTVYCGCQRAAFEGLVDTFSLQVSDLSGNTCLDSRAVSFDLLKMVDETLDAFYLVHSHYVSSIKPCLMLHLGGYLSRSRRWRFQFVSRFIFVFLLLFLFFIGGRSTYLALRSSFIIPVDLLHAHSPQGFQIGGLSPVETFENVSFKWGYGPKTIFAFNQDKSRSLLLKMTVSSIIPDQALLINMNGKEIGHFVLEESGDMMKKIVSKSFVINTKPGLNVITIQYKYWNGNGVLVSGADQRFFAIPYLNLSLVNVFNN